MEINSKLWSKMTAVEPLCLFDSLCKLVIVIYLVGAGSVASSAVWFEGNTELLLDHFYFLIISILNSFLHYRF